MPSYTQFFKIIYLFIYLFIWLSLIFIVVYGIFSCSMWDLVPWPRIEPVLGMKSLSHWTSRGPAFLHVLLLELSGS